MHKQTLTPKRVEILVYVTFAAVAIAVKQFTGFDTDFTIGWMVGCIYRAIFNQGHSALSELTARAEAAERRVADLEFDIRMTDAYLKDLNKGGPYR